MSHSSGSYGLLYYNTNSFMLALYAFTDLHLHSEQLDRMIAVHHCLYQSTITMPTDQLPAQNKCTFLLTRNHI